MTNCQVVHCEAEDWAQAAKICADGLTRSGDAYTLGFVYATGPLAADLSSILTYLRQKTDVDHWVGCTGLGICASTSDDQYGAREYFHRPALCVMALNMPSDAFCVLDTMKDTVDELPGKTLDWMDDSEAGFGVVHGDPANALVGDLIEDLAARTSGFLVGGLSSPTPDGFQIADRVTGGGLSGVLFAPGPDIVTGLSQGCVPISESHVISDCIDNILIGLDGRPALEVFKEDIGAELAEDMEQVAGVIQAALPIEGSDTGDYLVRSLLGIDPERGWLAIGAEVDSGGRVLFVQRDPLSAETDMRQRLEKMKQRLGRPPTAALYYSCIGRGPALFAQEGRELSLIRDVFGDIDLVGFFGNGEISHNRLYGYTGVLTLIA